MTRLDGQSSSDAKIQMHSGQFLEVFDVAKSGYKDWTFPAFGLIFVAVGVLFFFSPFLGIPFIRMKAGILFRVAFLAFAILWAGASFFSTYSKYLRHRRLADDNTCSSVEGPVQDFVPMPWTGHAMERFSVSGVRFAYSDYVITDGFNTTSSHGGPITADSYVRICYDPADHAILRLEIRKG